MRKPLILSGLIEYNPNKAFNGYTLYTPMQAPTQEWSGLYSMSSHAHLIDMNGNEVHKWRLPSPPVHGILLENGNLLVNGIDASRDDPNRPGTYPGAKYFMGGGAGYLFELDWEGNIVFQHHDPSMHHDFDKLPNGNYIFLQWEKVPEEMQRKIRGGIKGTEFIEEDGTTTMFTDNFVEIDIRGQIVWEWHSKDHFDVDKDIIGPVHKREEWSHLNDVHFFLNDNGKEKIVTTSRYLDCMYELDKKTGEIEKRIGAFSYIDAETGCIEYRKTHNPVIPLGIPTLGGPHAAYVIPRGCPGAGNYLLYDNGMYAGNSRAVEYSKDSTTEKPIVIWESCQGAVGRTHYSSFISGAQRLPNGNTLICDGAMGRFFEIAEGTHDEVVWEFVNPHVICKIYNGAVFRAHRYGPDHCPQFNSLYSPNK